MADFQYRRFQRGSLLHPSAFNNDHPRKERNRVMSKKTNTFLFIILGSVFNIIITVSCFVIFLVIYSNALYPLLPQSSTAWVLPVIFVGSIVVSFFIYRLVVKIFVKKVDMEKHFYPIFGPRRPPNKN